MGTRSLDSENNPKRKLSFTLPSFRKATGEKQSVDTSAEEAERIRKAAAWQWYTRGVGELVVPTKRPTAGDAPVTASAEAVGANSAQSRGGQESGFEKKPAVPESRFKAEASARGRRRPPARGEPSATPLAAPSPLYDEVELSGLKTQMSDFVQRLQQKQQSEQKPVKPNDPEEAPQLPLPPSPAEEPGIRRSTSSSAEVLGFRRPISALHRFFRRVMLGSFHKSNSAPAPAIQKPEAPPVFNNEPEADDVQHHYHHYIHHHHHHYHHPSPEETELTPRRRRHSDQSSGVRPRIPALIWEENEEDFEDDEEESPITAYLARRRRYSASTFAEYNTTNKADTGEVVKWAPAEEPAKPAPELQLPRRRNSQRFSSEDKVPKEGRDDIEVGEGLWRSINVKSRSRRHLSESFREGEQANARRSMEEARAAREGGEAAGGVYKLSGAGAYNYVSKPVLGRRLSDGFVAPRRRAEEVVHEELRMYRGGGYDIHEERDVLKRWLRTPSPVNMRQHQPRRSVYPLSYQPDT